MGIPWRLALALQADGWWLRSDIIWSKKNPMPESCTDRPTKSHEYIFLLSKRANYYWDQEAVREKAHPETWGLNSDGNYYGENTKDYESAKAQKPSDVKKRIAQSSTALSGRNLRTVWDIPTQSSNYDYCLNCDSYYTGGDRRRIKKIKVIEDGEEVDKRVCLVCGSTEHWVNHFATFPEALVERCVKAGSTDRACGVCGAPWERVVEFPRYGDWHGRKGTPDELAKGQVGKEIPEDYYRKTLGFRPTCEHRDDTSRSIVLDPFGGSGTVALVALKHGRDHITIELNPHYIKLIEHRLKPTGNQPCAQNEVLTL